jgi:hypothetical protein
LTEDFSPRDILRRLEDAGVAYVVIDGLAAILQGSPIYTGDADICPELTDANLERLAQALSQLGARIRIGKDEPVPLRFDGRLLASARVWNLVTDHGVLDLSFEPSGTSGYSDLIRHAVALEVADGLTVMVASLDDVIRSKEAANRPKDHLTLPTLRKLRELRRERPDLP